MPDHLRGSTLYFTATCADASGAPITPDSAELQISYANANLAPAAVVVAMTIDGPTVSAEWDSSIAATTSPVAWHVRAVAGTAKVVAEGIETLKGNAANP